MTNILVTGVHEPIGAAVAASLLDAKVPFRVLVPTKELAHEFDQNGIPAIIGELRDLKALDEALEGTDRAFVAVNSDHQGLRIERTFVEAACRCNVRHLVMVSTIEVDPEAPSVSEAVQEDPEQNLRECDIDFTLFHAETFLRETSIDPAQPRPPRESFTPPPAPDDGIPVSDVYDIGEVVAKILQRGGHEGHTYRFTAREAMTPYNISKIVSDITGRQIDLDFMTESPEAGREILAGLGYPQWMADDLLQFNRLWNSSSASVFDDSDERVHRRHRPTSLAFIRNHMQRFLKKRWEGVQD